VLLLWIILFAAFAASPAPRCGGIPVGAGGA